MSANSHIVCILCLFYHKIIKNALDVYQFSEEFVKLTLYFIPKPTPCSLILPREAEDLPKGKKQASVPCDFRLDFP